MLPIAYYKLPVAFRLLPISYGLSPLASGLLPTFQTTSHHKTALFLIAYILPTAYCPMPIALYCLLPIAPCLLPTASRVMRMAYCSLYKYKYKYI